MPNSFTKSDISRMLGDSEVIRWASRGSVPISWHSALIQISSQEAVYWQQSVNPEGFRLLLIRRYRKTKTYELVAFLNSHSLCFL